MPRRHSQTDTSFESLEPRRLMAATLLTEVAPGALHANPNELTVAGDHLYFVVPTYPTGPTGSGVSAQLWRTDGTAGGTQPVTPAANRAPGSPHPGQTGRPGNKYYYGFRGLVAVGESIYCYEIGHGGAYAYLEVTVRRFDPDGTTTSQH